MIRTKPLKVKIAPILAKTLILLTISMDTISLSTLMVADLMVLGVGAALVVVVVIEAEVVVVMVEVLCSVKFAISKVMMPATVIIGLMEMLLMVMETMEMVTMAMEVMVMVVMAYLRMSGCKVLHAHLKPIFLGLSLPLRDHQQLKPT
jgi:hypothetical protein